MCCDMVLRSPFKETVIWSRKGVLFHKNHLFVTEEQILQHNFTHCSLKAKYADPIEKVRSTLGG